MKHNILFVRYATAYGHALVRDGRIIADVEYVTETSDAVFVTVRATGAWAEYPSVDAAIEALA